MLLAARISGYGLEHAGRFLKIGLGTPKTPASESGDLCSRRVIYPTSLHLLLSDSSVSTYAQHREQHQQNTW
jgi:hypothetical protein